MTIKSVEEEPHLSLTDWRFLQDDMTKEVHLMGIKLGTPIVDGKPKGVRVSSPIRRLIEVEGDLRVVTESGRQYSLVGDETSDLQLIARTIVAFWKNSFAVLHVTPLSMQDTPVFREISGWEKLH